MTLKNGFGKCSLFVLSAFPPKKTLIRRGHCSIGQWCCSMTSKWSIDWFLESSSGVKFFQPSVRVTNQKPRAFVSVRQTNQIALFPFVCSFCFVRACSRSHENRSICIRINNHFHLQGSKTSWILSCALDKQLSYFTFLGHFLLVLVTYTAFVRGWLAWNLAQWASKR